jgi:hypothetical protein
MWIDGDLHVHTGDLRNSLDMHYDTIRKEPAHSLCASQQPPLMTLLRCTRSSSNVVNFHLVQQRQLGCLAATRVANAALWRQRPPLTTSCSQTSKASPGGHSSDQGSTLQLRPPTPLEQINDATKWTVVTAVTATVGVRHDALSMWCVIGSVIVAAICKVAVVWESDSMFAALCNVQLWQVSGQLDPVTSAPGHQGFDQPATTDTCTCG